ncbi:restriction endonuclease subunit S [Marinilabilia salmonicolor]|nr:restriction endonuclease subunit S [Marinilabilia salmonicolor]
MENNKTNIPEGFQKTEVGMIPEDWEVKPIGATLQIRHGKSQKLVASAFGNYPILATGGNIGFAKEYLYNKPSVLIGRKGTINKPLYMDTPFWTVDTLFYSEVNKEYSAKYLFYNFCSINWYAYNEASGVPSLNAKTIENLLIPLPPTLAEQTAIANALSDMDALIDAQEKLIHKKRLIQQGAMQELLRPKEGWVEKTLGEVLKVQHGKSQKDVIDANGKYPILATGGIIGKANNFLYDKPSVLIGRKGTIDEPRYMERPFWSVDTLFYTSIKEGYCAKFIFYMFNLIDWYSYNEASGVPSLNAKTIELIEKYFPTTLKEQQQIAQTLSAMDTEIEQLETQLSKYKQMKTGMMQELLTGKKRLNLDLKD